MKYQHFAPKKQCIYWDTDNTNNFKIRLTNMNEIIKIL